MSDHWTRANDIWLDVVRRTPRQEGEGFAEWLARLSKLMQASRKQDEDEEKVRE